MSSNLSRKDLEFLVAHVEGFSVRKLSGKDSLDFKGWEAIRTWCDFRRDVTPSAPSIAAIAQLAKCDGVREVNEQLLRNSSSFQALRPDCRVAT